MCGASQEQEELQREQIDAYKQARDMTAKQYADQQAIFAPMAAQFKSVFERGPNAHGFSAEETQTLNAQVIEGTAENYEHAAKALGENLAARGGGDNPLVDGEEVALKGQLASSAAREESSEQQQIKQADYTQGRQNWLVAAGGLDRIAAGQNPVAYEDAATSSGSAASKTADDINTANNSWINAAIGAAGTVAGGFAGRH